MEAFGILDMSRVSMNAKYEKNGDYCVEQARNKNGPRKPPGPSIISISACGWVGNKHGWGTEP
jgi:hypothetical protein